MTKAAMFKTTSPALSFMVKVVRDGDLHAMRVSRNLGEWIITDDDRRRWALLTEFVTKHGATPSPELFAKMAGLGVLPDTPEAATFYAWRTHDDWRRVKLTEALSRSSSLLNDKTIDTAHTASERAATAMTEAVMAVRWQDGSQRVIDLATDRRIAWDTYVQTKAVAIGVLGNRVLFGWPTLDAMAAGAATGDVITLLGRPGSGKTFCLCHMAHHAWRAQGRNVLFVSMEIKPGYVAERVAAIDSKLPYKLIAAGQLTTGEEDRLKQWVAVNDQSGSKFVLVDGAMTATVDDIELLANMYRPDAIYIDGAYLLQVPGESDRYRRAAVAFDLIKQRLSDFAPVFCTYQFARSATKKRNTSDVGLEDAGYTDAIGQHSSVVLGLFEEENVQTERERVVRVLKGRKGETGEFVINWIFDYSTDFSEVPPSVIAETGVGWEEALDE